MKNSLFIKNIVTFVLVSCAINVYSQTYISQPGILNKNGETYILTQDITTNGGAFTISGDNITFDLAEHTITYNNGPISDPGINIQGNNTTLKNGKIVQGSGKSPYSAAVASDGLGNEISYLAIHVNGIIDGSEEAAGIVINDGEINVHHVFINNTGETNSISYVPTCISIDDRWDGNINLYNNYFLNSHVAIYFVMQGYRLEDPPKCQVYNNYIQHVRTPGTKAPYALLLAQSRNIEIFNNQIISDEGRGIIIDGWGQGVPRGSDFNNIHDNRIDIQYTTVASSGEYVENNVFGLYDRYSTGNNTFENNIVMVDNKAGGATACVYVGSDGTDPLMVNLMFKNNTFIVYDQGDEDVSAVRYAVADEVSVIDNQYLANVFSMGNWSYHNGGGIPNLTETGNTAITLQAYTPAAPTNLRLTRFFNSYILEWDDNFAKGEAQTYEYIVYRDNQKLDISPRGGTFFIDENISGQHTYSLRAINLSGTESAQSSSVSTAAAKDGWWGGSSSSASTPQGLKVTK
jgi:hypothetical protein